jgi:hypothetical protein
MSDPDFSLYFFEKHRNIPVRTEFKSNTPIFRFFAVEILRALNEFMGQCTHDLTTDITIENVFVQHGVTRLVLKNLTIGEQRVSDEALEFRLLRNYGEILMALLRI